MSVRYLYKDANFVIKTIKGLKNTIDVVGDYFRVLYFRFSEVPKNLQKFIDSLLIANANLIGYIFPT